MGVILHYDTALGYAVLNKPQGIDTYGFVEQTASHILLLFRRAAMGAGDCPSDKKDKFDGAHAIHRLDKPTSGCLVVGLNPSARRRLARAIIVGSINKTYLAVVRGVPSEQSGFIDAPLAEQRVPHGSSGHSVICVDPVHGKPSLTSFEVLASNDKLSLVRLSPLTGRTHQLRVHCAHIGCPIVGDPWYPTPEKEGKTLHLHAFRIALPETTFGGIHVTAQIPDYMKKTLQGLSPSRA